MSIIHPKGRPLLAESDLEYIDEGNGSESKSNSKLTPKSKKLKNNNDASPTPVQRHRVRGKLKMLPEMPMDILFEIFSCLNPLDVLHLCRTTKTLRNILISRSALTVWRAAFIHEPEIPAPPADLNEPQWANLLFSRHCHYCLVSGGHSILWNLRTRVCTRCVNEHFGSLSEVLKRMKGKLICNYTQLLCISYAGNRQVFSYVDSRAVNLQLALSKRDQVRLAAYVKDRTETLATHYQFESKCNAAMELRKIRISREAEVAQEKCRERILQRLEELGYREEVNFLNKSDPQILLEHRSIKQTKELTECVWTNILPPLIELMKDAKEKMLKKQRRSLLRKRLRLVAELLVAYTYTRPINEAVPQPADVCIMPQIKAMLEDPAPEAYADLENFAELQVQLHSLCRSWVSTKNKELLSLIPRQTATVPPGTDDSYLLELATTFFKCPECIEPISYPRILAHSCLRALRIGNRNREDDLALIFSSLDSEPWNFGGGRITYFSAASASARFLVSVYGLNPDIATAADLNNANRWLECLHCGHPIKGRSVFKWQKAILHDMMHITSENRPAKWRILSDGDAQMAQNTEDTTYLTHHNESPDFVCLQCHEEMSFGHLEAHVRFKHDIHELHKGNYSLALDAGIQPPFSVIIPHRSGKRVVDLVVSPSSGRSAEDPYVVDD